MLLASRAVADTLRSKEYLTYERTIAMTILVAYAPRPEGQAALEKGIEIAKRRQEHLLVVNATPGGGEDAAMASASDVVRVERLLEAQEGLSAEFKQFGRGKSTVDEIEAIVESQPISLLVIGLRRRSAVGKAILGSVAHDLLMTIACPILAVKA